MRSRLFAATLVAQLAGCNGVPRDEAARTTAALSSAPRTALVGVHVGRAVVAQQFVALKDHRFDPDRSVEPDATLRVEVWQTGGEQPLGVGEVRAPELCACPSEKSHFVGDVVLPHDATVLIRVPWIKGDERTRLFRRHAGGDWRLVAEAALAREGR